ncbi:hypothetical protein GGF46_005149 [Coemansia sp. RSA 552]|nr:hypothetical protein GGF46_005149 [Coemansia sp. RSA 552]
MTIIAAFSLPGAGRFRLMAPEPSAPEPAVAAVGTVGACSPGAASRTANAFSLPVGQLSEPLVSHGADDMQKIAKAAAGDDEAGGDEMDAAWVQRLLVQLASSGRSPVRLLPERLLLEPVLPEPLRTLGWWHEVDGPRRCIAYLEPRRSTPLYTAIEEFFATSADAFGPTEAHQYHPHSSMTGFIDLPGSAAGGARSGQVMARIASHLHRLIAPLAGRGAAGSGPEARVVTNTSNYPHAGTHKIGLRLDTPEVFRRLICEVAAAVPEAGIRPKRLSHISLAYFNKHVLTSSVISADAAERLEELARSLVYTPDVFDAQQNPWDIAFYELSSMSLAVGTPHRFTQIARWQL